jgi:HAE1 family hydrophobic/amphiphilic exporter-1/multidrug efflux pump
MSLTALFIERPVATSLLAVGILLAGLAAYPLLPLASLPLIDFPTIEVSTNLPGANSETMASSVTTPLERQFSQIAGVTDMTSTSALGSSTITLQFDLARNIDAAAQDVQAAINAAAGQLPKNLPTPPIYRTVNPADVPILVLGVSSDTHPPTDVHDHADTVLAQQISRIFGVAEVDIVGAQKPAIRVQIDPSRIASLGISFEDVRTVLATATANTPKGSFDGPARSASIYANDQLTKAEAYSDVIVAYRNGSAVRIRDIGTVINGPEDTRVAAWQNGKPGIQLIVFKKAGANVVDTVDRIRAALPRLQAAMLPGIDVRILIDRTQTIRAAVRDVQVTMAVAIGLVMMVVFLFLRSLRATIIPSVTMLTSLVGTFALMYVFGYSIDNLSVMGLTIAIGFVIDDAIVMLENIHRHVESGMGPLEAALRGAKEIGFTVISISLSLVAVFIPLLLMGGIVGRLFREFAVTITVAVLLSAALSLTLTPSMCAQFLRDPQRIGHTRLYWAATAFFDALFHGYACGLRWVLRHRRLTMCALLLVIAANGYLYVAIPKGLLPEQDTGFIFGVSEAAQDISFSAMAQRQLALARIVAADPDIANFAAAVGATAGAQTTNTGRFWIGLRPHSERRSSSAEIIKRLRTQVADVEGVRLFMQTAQDVKVGGRFARTQYQYTLQDANLEELNEWTPRILDRLKALPELQDVASDQQTDAATVTMTIDRDTAGRFGIQSQVIDDTLYDAFGQRQVAQYFTQLSQYHVVLEVDPKLQTDPAALEKIHVRSPITGQQVPLSAFVKVDTTRSGYLSINHQGQFPAATLSFNLSPGVALGQAIEAIQKVEAEIAKPATLVATFQGSAQVFQSSLSTQPYLIAAVIVVLYLVLGMLYESYVHPITVLSTLPSAGFGALLFLMAFSQEFNTIVLIGILLLMGIAKKNAIMMIDFALVAEREHGFPPEQSIYQACLQRFRPIMMTTMTTLLSAVPLMLDYGVGSEFRRPLGYSVVGGLLLSQALTLYTTPVVYLYMNKLGTWRSRLRPFVSPPRLSAAQRIAGLDASAPGD